MGLRSHAFYAWRQRGKDFCQELGLGTGRNTILQTVRWDPFITARDILNSGHLSPVLFFWQLTFTWKRVCCCYSVLSFFICSCFSFLTEASTLPQTTRTTNKSSRGLEKEIKVTIPNYWHGVVWKGGRGDDVHFLQHAGPCTGLLWTDTPCPAPARGAATLLLSAAGFSQTFSMLRKAECMFKIPNNWVRIFYLWLTA